MMLYFAIVTLRLWKIIKGPEFDPKTVIFVIEICLENLSFARHCFK